MRNVIMPLEKLNNTIPAPASSTNLSAQSTTFFNYILCGMITEIWYAFKDAFISWCSQAQPYSFGLISYPEVNRDLSTQKVEKIYWGLGKENKWRECIDGVHHQHGKFCFDKGTHGGAVEPGFIGSMENSFEFISKHLNEKVDADWYLRLHKQTTAHFQGKETCTLIGQEKSGVFRSTWDYLCHKPSNVYIVTPEAIAEFRALDLELQQKLGPDYGLGKMGNDDECPGIIKISFKPMKDTHVCRIFNKFMKDYYTEVENAQSPDKKLWAIARLQQRVEWLHAVVDGTSRTNLAMMNKCLCECGFHPAILKYPHLCASWSLRRWKEYLQEGLIEWERVRDQLNPT
jgi:hypothetical protein